MFNPSVLTNDLSDGDGQVKELSEEIRSLQLLTLSGGLQDSSGANLSKRLAVGDIVQILNEIEQVSVLQAGHGEWTEAMIPVMF